MSRRYNLENGASIIIHEDDSANIEDCLGGVGVDDARDLLRVLQEHFGEVDAETVDDDEQAKEAVRAVLRDICLTEFGPRIARLEAWAMAHAEADSALLPEIVANEEWRAHNAFGEATMLQQKAAAFRRMLESHEKFLANLGGEAD